MKVQLLETYGKQKAGKIVELPDSDAEKLISQGYAVPLVAPKINKPAPPKGGGKEKSK